MPLSRANCISHRSDLVFRRILLSTSNLEVGQNVFVHGSGEEWERSVTEEFQTHTWMAHTHTHTQTHTQTRFEPSLLV